MLCGLTMPERHAPRADSAKRNDRCAAEQDGRFRPFGKHESTLDRASLTAGFVEIGPYDVFY